MRFILLGAPGSGKGTQADLLKKRYGCAHISTGDILRLNLKDETELGLRARDFMQKGELVPDELVIEMVEKRLQEADAAESFLMDGFPRTLSQAEAFGKILEKMGQSLDMALLLKIDEESLVRRLINRRTCRSCGKIWNLLAMPSETKTCPECEGELYQRDDDAESVIRRRLEVYRAQTTPLVSWYEKAGKLRIVNAEGSAQEIFESMQVVLGR
ncbi:MAG: adenylate kinase [Synergistaceae bacterium]|nr:adenylate kinase [Synergistaceae bacterium]